MSSKFFRGGSLLTGNNTIPGQELTQQEKEVFIKVMQLCRDYGCDFYDTVVQKLTYDEMSEIAAYGGFPKRFPHWKWGMEYEELQRGYEYGQHRIYEMVTNTVPCYIYILNSNTLVDNVTVVAHATFHNDFFKNNIRFTPTSQNMMNQLANHGSRITRYMNRWGIEKVTEFIDHVMRIQTLIDVAKSWDNREIKDHIIRDSREYEFPRRLKVDEDRMYMDPWINTQEFRDQENERIEKNDIAKELSIFSSSDKDIFGFIKNNAPFKPWQADIAAMLYEEAMYFAPQRATKTGNEAWACGKFNSLVQTDLGLMRLGEIVDNKLKVKVFDGEKQQVVSNWYKFDNRETYKVTTKLGYEFEGSLNHRVLKSDNVWIRLDEVATGTNINIGFGGQIWPEKLVALDWTSKQLTNTKMDIARKAKVSYDSIIDRYTTNEVAVNLLAVYDEESKNCTKMHNFRKSITTPGAVNEKLAYWLGLMIGDGHISVTRRTMGLTTGDESQADLYVELTHELFGLKVRKKWDDSSKNGRWRLSVTSKNLQEFCQYLGLKTGSCARQKCIPDVIMKSPEPVVSSFLRGLYDCDGYAGPAGVILSTSSTEMSRQVQCMLLNYGIVSKRTLCAKDIWQVRVGGPYAITFFEMIGFFLERKNERLAAYIHSSWGKNRVTNDEIVTVEKTGQDTVYDITVENTHRYAAQGFINHNSFGDYEIMTRQGYVGLGQKTHDSGIIQYAVHKMGVLGGKYSMNPYKLGFSLLLYIEDRWNKGKFGTEWENCRDRKRKKDWDLKLGLGKEKLFEVRKYYDDVTLINEFFTQEFCDEYEFFEWKHYPNGETRIESKDAKKIKKKLLERHLNGGLPDIRLVDPNHRNRGWLLLEHVWDGRVLYEPYAREVMASLYYFWQHEIVLSSHGKSGEELVVLCVGTDPDKDIVVMSRDEYDRS